MSAWRLAQWVAFAGLVALHGWSVVRLADEPRALPLVLVVQTLAAVAGAALASSRARRAWGDSPLILACLVAAIVIIVAALSPGAALAGLAPALAGWLLARGSAWSGEALLAGALAAYVAAGALDRAAWATPGALAEPALVVALMLFLREALDVAGIAHAAREEAAPERRALASRAGLAATASAFVVAVGSGALAAALLGLAPPALAREALAAAAPALAAALALAVALFIWLARPPRAREA